MGKKDLTQKTLESFPDVFTDCVNVLLYRGNEHLQADRLQPAPTETTYPDVMDELHNQFQDVSKYDIHNGKIKAQYTIENQALADRKMAHLPPEVRQLFKSDMRIVVDYLAEGKDYVPTEQKIVHVEALFRMLRALSNDNRFEEILNQLVQRRETEDVNMCELLDKYWYGGVAEGVAKGKAESIGNIRGMYNHNLPAETIAELINQNCEYINQIISLFNQYPTEDDLSIAKRLLTEQKTTCNIGHVADV